MSDELELTLAVSRYEHLADVTTGRERVEGVRLRTLELTVEDIFQRFVRFREWDVSELSMGGFHALVGAGDRSLVGLPVFPSRVFRHSAIYVRAGAVRDPRELAGARIGVPEWAQTAVIYARALLMHEWDVPLESVAWTQAGVNEPGRREKVDVELPAGVRLTRRPEDTLDELLLAGELDAVISAHPPAAFEAGDPRVVRLLPASAAMELDYARRTGVVPIMHLLVLRREVHEEHPWVARNLVAAFERARAASIARLRRVPGGPASPVPLLWADAALERTAEAFGGEPWAYGVEANSATLEAFAGWCHEQGVTGRRVELDELFPASTRFASRI